MTVPAILALIVFAYLPMFGIVIAFKNINYTKGILGSAWVGLKNFEYLFKTNDAFVITRKLRLSKAKALLANQSLPISEVCRLSGYSDVHYFAKAFKKNESLTPSEYRSLTYNTVKRGDSTC